MAYSLSSLGTFEKDAMLTRGLKDFPVLCMIESFRATAKWTLWLLQKNSNNMSFMEKTLTYCTSSCCYLRCFTLVFESKLGLKVGIYLIV